MPELVLTRGIPASGKTTWARGWVAEDPAGRARVNRDDLRLSLYGQAVPLTYQQEEVVTLAQHAAVRSLLAGGTSVVVDDTNLRLRYVRGYADIAREAGASLALQDFDVPLEFCLLRDERRGRRVGEQAIRDMHARWRSAREHGLADLAPDAEEEYRYEPDPSLPPVWIFDVDGTLALMRSRGPFEWHRVGEDDVNAPVRDLAVAIRRGQVAGRSLGVVILSGRDECCREATEAWLHYHQIFHEELVMRPSGDHRKDAVVKLELFRERVAPRYSVVGVVDDRQQVVDMWRRIGLLCVQVAPGDF